MDSFYIWHKWSLSLEGVSRVIFFQNPKIWILGKFYTFFGLDLEKKSTVLDGLFPYLAQMITSIRGCVACNDLWPWLISSRSFGLGLENRVRSVASTVLDGLFPYLIQMITSMRKCVPCDDLWPWPISSRSFDLDFENCVRSVTFSVLDRLFPYLPQMINTIRGYVVCLVYNKIIKFQLFANFSNFSAFTLKNKKSTFLLAFFPYLAQIIISIRGCVACNDLWHWPIFSRSFGLDLENRVRSVASTVLDGFFPYLVQMITSMRKCVACDDLWPWPISARSCDLDFENRVRYVTVSVLDQLFPYLAQIITTIRGCVACLVYNKIIKFQFFTNFSTFSAFILFDLGSDMNWWIVWTWDSKWTGQ